MIEVKCSPAMAMAGLVSQVKKTISKHIPHCICSNVCSNMFGMGETWFLSTWIPRPWQIDLAKEKNDNEGSTS